MRKTFYLILASILWGGIYAQQNVGIGTNVPVSKLDVTGNITIGTDYSGQYAAPSNGALIEGNVGIGTAGNTVSALLSVGWINGNAPFQVSASGIVTLLAQNTNNIIASGSILIGTTTASAATAGAGAIRWSGTVFQYSDGTNWLTFTSGGGSNYWTLSGNNLYNNSGTNTGIGTSVPTQTLSFDGTSARTIWMERNTASNSAGNNLTVQSGGASTGATNQTGGDLKLSSGTSTGSAASNVRIYTSTPGAAGTSDNAPSEKMTIVGGGSVGIGNPSPYSSAILDLTTTTQGLLPPRLTTTERNAVDVSNNAAAQGLTIYNITTHCIETYIGTTWQPIGCGCTTAPSTPIAFITSAATVCQGYNGYEYAISEVAGASSYVWTVPTGASIASGNSSTDIVVDFATDVVAGPQTISVAASNSCGTSSNLNLNITVDAIPAISTQPQNSTICASGGPNTGNTTFSVVATGTGLTYQWQVNNGGGFINVTNSSPYSGATTSTLTITAASTSMSGYAYQCIVNGTCTPSVTSSSATLTVNAVPSVTTPTTDAICSGSSPAISLTSSIPSSFAWTIGTITGGITGASASSGSTINQTLADPSHTATGTVPYLVVPTSTSGSCAGATTSITVTVNPAPAVTTPSTASVCDGVSPNISLTSGISSTYAWTIGTITGSITGASAGSGSTINAQPLTNPSNSSSGTVQYIVTPTSTANSCVGNPYTITVTVNPTPVVTTSSSASICNNSATGISLTATTASSYTWTLGTNTGSIGGPTACSSSCGSSINQTLTNPSNSSAGSIVYNVTPTSTTGSCAGSAYPITVTVNPSPIVTTATTASTCSGTGPNISLTASTPSSFAWTIGTVTHSISGATSCSSSCGSTINQTLTDPYNYQSGTVQYIVTPTASTGSCAGPSATITVTVNPNPAITATNNAPTICSGSATNITLSSSVTGTTYSWSSTEDPTISGASTGTSSSIAQTLTNSTNNTSATATYTITGTANTCTGIATATVTVNPSPAVTTPNTDSICSGGTTAISLTASVASSFTWTLGTNTGSVNGASACSSSCGSSISQMLSVTSNSTAGSIIYNVTPKSSSGSCAGSVYPITVTVDPKPIVTTAATASTCSGTGPNISLTASTPSSFTWTIGTVTGVTGATSCSSTCGSTINQTLNYSGSTSGTVKYIVTPTATTGSCPGTSATITVTVYPIPTITANPTTICSGNATSIGLSSSVAGTTYSWNSIEDQSISGAGSGVGSPIAQTLSNSSNSTSATATSTVTGTANTCTGTATAVVTVNPTPSITALPSAVSVCSGSAPSIVLSSSATGTTCKWSVSEQSGISGATSCASSCATTIAQTLANNSNTTSATATYTITGTASSCSAATTAVVTVNPRPGITANPSSTTLCTGGATNIALSSTLSGTTYAWSIAEASTVTGGSSGTGSPIAQTLSNSNTTTSATATYTITGTDPVNSCTASITSVVGVNPIPVISASPSAPTICSGSGPDIILSGTVSGTTYSWSSTEDPTISGAGSGTSSAINQVLTSTNTTSATATYTITGTANTCTASSITVVVTVNPTPTISLSAGTNPICLGSSTSLTATPSGGSGAYSSYAWTGSGIAAATTTVTGNSATPISGGLQAYTVVVTDGNGCTSTAGSTTVTVNNTSTAPTGVSGGGTTVCSGSAVTLTATGGTLGYGATYQWGTGSTPGTNPISGATSVSYTVSPTATTNYWVSITSAAPCSSPSGSATTTVTVTTGSSGIVELDNFVTGGNNSSFSITTTQANEIIIINANGNSDNENWSNAVKVDGNSATLYYTSGYHCTSNHGVEVLIYYYIASSAGSHSIAVTETRLNTSEYINFAASFYECGTTLSASNLQGASNPDETDGSGAITVTTNASVPVGAYLYAVGFDLTGYTTAGTWTWTGGAGVTQLGSSGCCDVDGSFAGVNVTTAGTQTTKASDSHNSGNNCDDDVLVSLWIKP